MQHYLTKFIVISAVFLSAGALVSCGYEEPDIKVPDVLLTDEDIQKMFYTCDKKETEQPVVASEILNRKIVVEDEIASMDLEWLGCDGTVSKKEHGSERDLYKVIQVNSPDGVTEAVGSISIENFRTCSIHQFDATDADIESIPFKMPDGTLSGRIPFKSEATRSGKMNVMLSDSKNKYNSYLNVVDGLNVLKVRYFGKCLKMKDAKDRVADVPADSFLNCLESKEIGSQDLVIDLKVHRPEVSGVKQIPAGGCEKK